MIAYIQTDSEGEFYNINAYLAAQGFKKLGFKINKFHKVSSLQYTNKEDILVGGVGTVREYLKKFNIHFLSEMEYPTELQSFLGRKIWSSTVKEAIFPLPESPIFIKPKRTKLFTGKIIKTFKDTIELAPFENEEVWCSEYINFETEWRCFIRYKQILDIRYYNGKWDNKIDLNTIKSAIKSFTKSPAAYSLDFGITKEGKLLLVEVNDGHSLGSYGIGAISYAKFLSARWAEITNTNDFLNF